jgi:hypothetical protein
MRESRERERIRGSRPWRDLNGTNECRSRIDRSGQLDLNYLANLVN